MSKSLFQKWTTAILIAVLLSATFANLAMAATQQAPLAQAVRSQQVKGTIAGGKFAKIWLGLEPANPGAQITVTNDWDRDQPLQHGVGFFILDSTGLVRAQAGEALNTIALAAGNPSFTTSTPSNELGASLNAVGTAKYTIVVYNDSNTDANFTLNATNAFIVDDANQVTNPNAAQSNTPVAGSAEVTTTTAVTNTGTTVSTPAEAATSVAATATPAPAETATAAPVAVGTPGVVKAKQLSGDLPQQDAQHFLGLEPGEKDATITLRLTFDPQDSSELARRLNFWVLDQAGFTQFQNGANASDVAIAAGSRDVDSQANERVAHFKSVGFGPYTVIVYNNSRVPGSYTLSVEGGLLVDDSGQTRNAKQAAAVSTTGTTTTTTTTTTTAAATPGATTAPAGTTTPAATEAARTGTPGGSYTVKAGDTLALIARDIYGDYKLYQQLCDFNNIANCNAVEIGQVVKLPTQAQITAGITRSATAATTPAATTAAATPAAATTTVATTAATTTTAQATATPAVAATSVSATGAMTDTTGVGTTSASTTTASAGTGTIIDTLTANAGFKTLLAAAQATGLESTLEGAGPFTVFAPTDAAFARLPAGALQQLMANPGGQLTDIVRYHVIKGKLMAADLSNGLQATTVQGKPVKFEVSGNTIKINGARILTKDIQTTNGVIHVIESVIIPPAE